MKPQIRLEEAVGSDFDGFLVASGVLLLSFGRGFVCVEAHHRPEPVFEENVEVDTDGSLDWLLFEPQELHSIRIGEPAEIEEKVAKVRGLRNHNLRQASLTRLRSDLLMLKTRHPEDFRELAKELLERSEA